MDGDDSVNGDALVKVDIVAGGINPTSIAVLKFETVGNVVPADAAMIRDVVEADLKRTGLFRIVDRNALPEYVPMGKMPNFKLWQAIKTQVLVQAKLSPSLEININWNSLFGMSMAKNR